MENEKLQEAKEMAIKRVLSLKIKKSNWNTEKVIELLKREVTNKRQTTQKLKASRKD